MAQPFRSLDELAKYIQEHYIDKVLEDEVASVVRDVEASQVKKTVYDGYKIPEKELYSPRRWGDGGLMDKRNMRAVVLKGVLIIKNVADGHSSKEDGGYVDYTDYTHEPNYLAGIIEYGRPTKAGLYTRKIYNGVDVSGQYLGRRPFTKNTIEQLRKTNAHVKALKRGLLRMGLKVK